MRDNPEKIKIKTETGEAGEGKIEEGVQEEKTEIGKHLALTITTKEGDFSFEEMPFEKLNIDKKIAKNAFKEVKEITEEENKFFEKFSCDKNIIEEVIMDAEDDNYFCLEREEKEPRAIKFPGRNNEILKTTETTRPIIRHEAFHQAMRLENYQYQIEMQENIEKGKNTEIPFFEKEIKTSKFKEFIEEAEYGKSFLDVMMAPSSAKPMQNIQKLIEEKLADFHMISQEISKNGLKKGNEIVINAKLNSLNIIAQNKGLKDYKELPSITENYYGLINGRNTLVTLKELSKKAGNQLKVKEFEKVIEGYEDKIKKYIKEQKRFKEVIGYVSKEDLEKTNEKFLKSFDEIIKKE